MTLCISPSFYLMCSFFTVVMAVFIVLLHFVAVDQGAFLISIDLGDLVLYCWLFFMLELLFICLGHLVLNHWINGQFYGILVALHLIAPKLHFQFLHVKCPLSLIILTGIVASLAKEAGNGGLDQFGRLIGLGRVPHDFGDLVLLVWLVIDLGWAPDAFLHPVILTFKIDCGIPEKGFEI